MRQQVKPSVLNGSLDGQQHAPLFPQFVTRLTEPQKVLPQGPQASTQNSLRDTTTSSPTRVPVQPNTYLVTSGAEVGRTVFLRASIQFRRMPEVMADKV